MLAVATVLISVSWSKCWLVLTGASISMLAVASVFAIVGCGSSVMTSVGCEASVIASVSCGVNVSIYVGCGASVLASVG